MARTIHVVAEVIDKPAQMMFATVFSLEAVLEVREKTVVFG